MIVSQNFQPKRAKNDRLPPGQYETKGFPVLSLGPAPRLTTEQWQLEISGLVAKPQTWNWESFQKLTHTDVTKDIHCVTKWSKFDTKWQGVLLDEIIRLAGVKPQATHIIASSADGYTTNLPIKDLIDGQAMVADSYDSQPITNEHGGPARLLVPHLYFWKSAKWLIKIEFTDHDQPGFWETRGYHNYGDYSKEQRYSFDN